MQKLDILAFGAHPDDVELSCGGIMAKHARLGKKTAIIDFTKGELGTRGTPEIRMKEAANAATILGIKHRENLNFKDGFFKHDEEHLFEIIKKIRYYKPDIVLGNAPDDRHPDHGKASAMVKEAAFLSGLEKIETTYNNTKQEAWRPKKIFFYMQSMSFKPDLLVDITEVWEIKMKSIIAYKSQFHNQEYQSDEPDTYISSPEFLDMLKARDIQFGQKIGVKYAEGFVSNTFTGISDFYQLIFNNR